MSQSDLDDIAALDEILQLMYWLEGEKLAARADSSTLARFIALDEARIDALLARLSAIGLVCAGPRSSEQAHPQYVFTTVGRAEAARRFADEFAGMTKPGHGECGDPDCECHRTGSPNDCRHRVERS